MTEHERARLERLERIARRMDKAFRVPFTGIRLGWDSILGIVPGIGDTLTTAPAFYIVYEAHRLGASKPLVMRMVSNIGIDWLVGLIPLFGDLLDVGIKSNMRNVQLLRAHMERAAHDAPPSRDIRDRSA
ncbi:DUF4112 domain-containing protein [Roseovarius sp. SCSIO 43702]|uniref:DUF4112 domain-containing protein n=1 Tax=Roseovarius sp. SCSIO 43702 TaxID=2823043 RepID=UPI001C736C27|nr:DUF4112 domain-containing protein [Roseovarius sp. SCSIO 43702]QYX58336.1 DUF4112 domain-containing protein [Roseovarius sp. SCSIO 43702]